MCSREIGLHLVRSANQLTCIRNLPTSTVCCDPLMGSCGVPPARMELASPSSTGVSVSSVIVSFLQVSLCLMSLFDGVAFFEPDSSFAYICLLQKAAERSSIFHTGIRAPRGGSSGKGIYGRFMNSDLSRCAILSLIVPRV